MANFKLTLVLGLGFLLCFNLTLVSSRAFGDDDDDDFGDLFGASSEEKSEEEHHQQPAEEEDEDIFNPPPVARAIPPAAPVPPAKEAQEEEAQNESSFWGSDSEEEPEQQEATNNKDEDHESHSHHHHHNHHQESPTKSLNSQPEPQKSLQQVQIQNAPSVPVVPNQWGSVRLGFNETCNPQLDSCNSERYFKCDSFSRVCGCIDSYTYIRSQERCFPIVVGDQRCEFNDQCHAGRWGRLSRCDRDAARCECYDVDQYGQREVVKVNGVCMIKKSMYESCSNTTECESIQGGAVICDYPDASVDPGRAEKQCRCERGHIWEIRQGKCLKIATQGLASECSSDEQCVLSSLGEKSWCSKETAKCECRDPANPGQDYVVFYKPRGKCFGKKDWNDTCTEHDECKASISSKAECLPDPFGSTNTTCQCPSGKTCPRDVDGPDSGFIVGSSGFFTITAFIVTLVFARL